MGYRVVMSTEREGLIGKASPPHGQETAPPQTESVPSEEHVDEGQVEDDLAKSPEEKRNATDGYAPADEGYEPTDADEDLAE